MLKYKYIKWNLFFLRLRQGFTVSNLSKWFVAMSLFVFFVFFDAFGLESEARRISQNIGSSFLAPFYQDKETKNEVLVVLFSNDYLKQGHGWPAKFSDHSLLLNRIAKYQPAAVFYDIIFAKRNEYEGKEQDIAGFVRTIKRVKKIKNVDVIIPYDTDQVGIKEIYAPSVTEKAVIGWNGHGVFYPPHVDGHKTVAFDLYDRWLEKQGKSSNVSQFVSDLFVMWGVKDSPENSFWDKFSKGIELTKPLKITDQQDYIKTSYIEVIQASDFYNSDKKDLEKLIKNKVVLIGTNLTGVSDFHETPMYGLVPGVFVHAMAFDNLVNYQHDYYKDGDSFEVFGVDLPSLIEVIVLGVLLIIGKYTSEKETSIRENGIFEKNVSATKESIFVYGSPKEVKKKILKHRYFDREKLNCQENMTLMIGDFDSIKHKIKADSLGEIKKTEYQLDSLKTCFAFKLKWFVVSVVIIISAMLTITFWLRSDPGNFIGLISADLVGYTLIENVVEIIMLCGIWIFSKLINR